jgi:hypothetical protein
MEPRLWCNRCWYHIFLRLKSYRVINRLSVSRYDVSSGRLLLEYPISTEQPDHDGRPSAVELSFPSSTTPSASVGSVMASDSASMPKTTFSKARGSAVVSVDTSNILQSVQRDDLQIGCWLNVLGYIRREQPHEDHHHGLAGPMAHVKTDTHPRQTKKAELSATRLNPIYVDAAIVFAAHGVRVDEYERILREAQEVERRIERP